MPAARSPTRAARRAAGPPRRGRGRARQQWRRRLRGGAPSGRARLSRCASASSASAQRLKGDAALAAERWSGPVEPASPVALADCDIVIDALFGAGLDRPVEGLPRAMIEAMNASRRAGHRGRSAERHQRHDRRGDGRWRSRPTQTVTFFRRKTGHLLLPGRLHCGTRRRSPISAFRTACWSRSSRRPSPTSRRCGAARFRCRGRRATNIRRGHAVVVSGGLSTTGAARLAARGALRAGRGSSPSPARARRSAVNAAASLAVMVRPVDGAAELAEFLADQRRNAVVLGPGGGVGAGDAGAGAGGAGQ